MPLFLSILIIFIFILLSTTAIAWVITSRSIYTNEILRSGQMYVANGKRYIMPNIDIQGRAYKLKDNVLEAIHTLVGKIAALMEEMEIPWWCTGGTLLGIERHCAIPMPFDDDADIAVPFEYLETIFSQEFKDKAFEKGITCIQLICNNTKRADRHGSVMRAQHSDGRFETVDIFFWKSEGDIIYKLDGWYDNGTLIQNKNETFRYDDVYPLRTVECDGLTVKVPNKTRSVLKTQYGDSVFYSCRPRPILISHAFAMRLLHFLFKRG